MSMIQVYALKSFDHGEPRRRGEIFSVPAATAKRMAARGLVSVTAPVTKEKWDVAVCIASGPSLTKEDVEIVRKWRESGDRRGVIVTNTTFRMAPWADALYFMDRQWWDVYGGEAKSAFSGRICAPRNADGVEKVHINSFNSGAGAVILAAQNGANRVILVGYDAKRADDGRAHWHEDHPQGLGNAGESKNWPRKFNEMASVLGGVEVINASRETAIDAFPRMTLEAALNAEVAKRDILIDGMNGLGDNIHQRAIVRELLKTHNVWIHTPWPSLYHDMGVKCLPPKTKLRTQLKNAMREKYTDEKPPKGIEVMNVGYPPEMVRKHRSVMKAMAAKVGMNAEKFDFSLPVPDEWAHGLDIPEGRPLVVFRPLVDRKEWGGNAARNPLKEAYQALYERVRKTNAFIVSVADLEEGKEWLAQDIPDADLVLHKGELTVNQLAALIKQADMVMTSPGMALVMAQAIGTPVVGVFGGYESGYSFNAGTEMTPTLCIEPIVPCDCFAHRHKCKKEIDMPAAISALDGFIQRYVEKA